MKNIIIILSLFTLTSCATLLGGRVDDCQRIKPATGARELRPGYFIANLILWPPGLGIDFLTGAIYKPCKHVAP